VKSRGSQEARRIRDELQQIATIVTHVERDWKEFARTGDDAYLKAAAYDIHGFYTGLERIFESVAATIDDSLPQGESWHKELLQRMGEEIPGVRPALLSSDSQQRLDEFVRFRHRIRNIYSFHLIPEKVGDLVEKLLAVFEQVRNEISDFARFLERTEDEPRS
jgi:hypothetical protein